MKTCTLCRKTLPLDQFGPKMNHGKMGLKSRCRKCVNADRNAKRQAKPKPPQPAGFLFNQLLTDWIVRCHQ